MQMKKINLLSPTIVRSQAAYKLGVKLCIIQVGIIVLLILLLFVLFTVRSNVWSNVYRLEYELGSTEIASILNNDDVTAPGLAEDIERILYDINHGYTMCFNWLFNIESTLPQDSVFTNISFSDAEVLIEGIGSSITAGEVHRVRLSLFFEEVRSGRLTRLDDGRYAYEIWASPGIR